MTSWPIRKKLLLLLLVVFLPASGIIVSSGLSQRWRAIEEAHYEALLLVQSLVALQEQIATGTKQMLGTLAHLPEIRRLDTSVCNGLFRELQREHPYYSAIAAARPDGSVFAASAPFGLDSVDLSDRKHIKNTIASLDFSVGEYQLGVLSKVPSIHYAYPVLDQNKKLIALVIAGFKLDGYTGFMERANLPVDSALTIADRKGIRLFRFPENAATAPGKPLPEDTIERISGDSDQGIYERTGQDGIERIYAFEKLRLGGSSTPYLYMIVGISKKQILHKANTEMLSNLLALGLTAFIAAALAWFFGNVIIIRPINRLVEATRRFGSGEMSARTDLAHTPDEMGQLARAFDDMASLLETKNLEREKAEEALGKSEEKFSKAFHHAPLLMTLARLEDGTYVDVNERFIQVSGFSRSEAIGKRSVELGWISPEAGNRLREVLKALGRVEGMEVTFRAKDGREVHGLYNGEIVTVDNRPCFLSIAQDITELRQVEEKIRHLTLRRTQEALDRLTLQNKLILDAAGEGIIGMNGDGRITFVNPAASKMLGWSVEELRGQSLHTLLHHSKADGAPYLHEECRVCAAYHGGETRNTDDEIFWKKDGTTFPVEYVSTPIVEQGEFFGTVLVFQDISERMQWERELRQAHKMQALGTLAGGIAHDFNNILATMILNTEMAMDEVLPEAPSLRNLERVLKAGNRARDLVEQILAFSRQNEHKKQPLNIIPIVKETLKLIKATIPPTTEVSLNVEACPDGFPALVLADPTQIHQVVMNLCANASHAMKEKGGRLTVDLCRVDLDSRAAACYSETVPGPYLVIRVSDTGHGIEQSILDRVFDPFFTTKVPGEGTGLGLSTAYGIVKSHGGSIRVESEPGRGTTFEVLLPRTDSAFEEKGFLEDLFPPCLPGGSERILIVDDEEELLDTYRKILDRLGYKVLARKNGREALEEFLARPERFDLIITDQTMPEMSGIELAEQVLKIRPRMPIILCTGYGEACDFKRAGAAGIREAFHKPFDRKQMAEAVRRVLDMSLSAEEVGAGSGQGIDRR